MPDHNAPKEPVPYDMYVDHTNAAWRGGIRDALRALRDRIAVYGPTVEKAMVIHLTKDIERRLCDG